MSRYEQAFQATLALSSLLVAAATGFSAHAATSPGHAYDARDIVVRDSGRVCVRTSFWNKENATKECNPELFPEPKVVPLAVKPAPAPAPVAKPKPVVVAPVVVAAPVVKKIVFPETELFAFGKADISTLGRERVEKARAQFRAEMSSATSIKIIGHTDNVGSAEFNQQLSLRRAEAVRDQLIKLGGEGGIMEVVGMGATKPVADNKTAEGRAKNRRVEVEVTGYAK